MLKTETKKVKKLFKGAVFGVACVLSLSAIPFSTLKKGASAATMSQGDVPYFSLDAAPTTAKKGQEYKIKKAKYTKGETNADVVLDDSDKGSDNITTSIKVRYKGQSQEEEVKEYKKGDDETVTATFVPQNVGTYVITYEVVDNEEKYTYNYEVVSSVSEASFEFDAATDDIFPSVYDTSLMETPKDVVIPTARLKDASGNEIKVKKDAEEVSVPTYFKGESVPSEEKEYIEVSINGLDDAIVRQKGVEEAPDKLVIKGEELAKEPRTYTLTYTYFQKYEDEKIYVTSATKEIKVESNYYKLSNDNDAKNGFELAAKFSESKPDKASIGTKIKLPNVTGTTSAKNSPSSEKIDVTFEVKVERKGENGNYETVEGWNKEDNTFTPTQKGDYKFSYTVKDFYYTEDSSDENNKKHIVNNENMTFWIYDVDDNIAPVVTLYDAEDGLPESFKKDEDGNILFKDAKNKVKTKTVDRNFVIYAIGANDNNKDESNKIELKRVIKDSRNRAVVTIDGYDSYNLIFNLRKSSESSPKSEIQQFLEDNPNIAHNIPQEQRSNDEQVKTWLKSHNYLIVTHDKEQYGDKDEATLIEQGLAYIDISDGEGEDARNYTFSTGTYNIYYIAVDSNGNSSEKSSSSSNYNDYVQMYITTDQAYKDVVAPTIRFNTSLQDTYLPTETFTFSEPGKSDRDENGTGDAAVEMYVGYRYLKGKGIEVKEGDSIEVKDKSEAITFFTNDQSLVEGKWYGKAGAHTENAFIVPEKNASGDYYVNLTEKPADATRVEVFVYAVDDYGNMGFFSKIVNIASVKDNKAPKFLADQTEKYETQNTAKEQDGSIQLPKVVYTDDYVGYMTHTIEIYYIQKPKDGEGENTYEWVEGRNSSSSFDVQRQTYTVYGGEFTANKSGDYIVSITVKDEGNNSITTFFKYNVLSDVKPEDIDITNKIINIKDGDTLELGKEATIQPPTLKVDDYQDVAFIGFDKLDDAKTANYYTVTMERAASSHYELKQHSFKATVPGSYWVKCKVFLLKYKVGEDTGLTTEVGEDNVTRLKYTNGGKNYYIMIDGHVNEKTLVDDKEVAVEPEIIAVDAEQGVSSAVVERYKESDNKYGSQVFTQDMLSKTGVELIVKETASQEIKVADTTKPVLTVEGRDYYDRTEPLAAKDEVDDYSDCILIEKLTAFEESFKGLHPTNSYVSISVKTPNDVGESTVYTEPNIEYGSWGEDARTNSSLLKSKKNSDGSYDYYLKLTRNGTYTITYYFEDYYNNKDSKPFTFTVGDFKGPEINVENSFFNKASDEYIVNEDELTLDITNGLSFKDDGKEYQGILGEEGNLVIEVRNEAGQLINKTAESHDYKPTYKLETVGKYTITIKITDDAGWTTTHDEYITVKAKDEGTTSNVYKTIGTVLIVLSAVILVGVIGYFIYSKIKMDKEVKGSGKKKAKKAKNNK